METNISKLLDVLEVQRTAADERLKYYSSVVESNPSNTDFRRFKSVALAEYHVFDSVIRMIQDNNVLDRVYTIWFEEP